MASNSGEELVDPVGSTTEDMPPDVRRSAAFGPAGSSSDENAVESSLTFPESSSSEITASMPAPGPSFLTTDNCLSSSDTTVTCYNKDVPDPDGVRGRCGLYNLGNTCFMNSGLQCLLSTVPLVKFLFNYKNMDQSVSSTLLGQFHELFSKVWSGRYSIIYPRDFKQTLGLYHPQFQDYRQHDCQEFLALLLDTLHEQLNYSRPANAANQISALGPNLKPQPTESDISMNNQSNASQLTESDISMNNQSSTGLFSDSEGKVMDQSRNVTSSHSSLTFENIKHGDRLVSSSNEVMQGKMTCSDGEKDVNSSNLMSFMTNIISEDSNQSTASEYSSDSEQCSVIKNLNLCSSPAVNRSNEKLSPKSIEDDFSKEAAVTSSADCVKKTQEMKINSLEEEIHGVRKKAVFDSQNEVSIKKSVSQDALLETGTRNKKVIDEAGDFDVDCNNGMDVCYSKSDADFSVHSSSDQSDQPVILNNAVSSSNVPSLEDIYAKETKTLNTNVLAEEYLSDAVTLDSDKFVKQDNTSSNRPEMIEEEGILNNILEASGKKDDEPGPRRIKDVNLRADKKSKLSKGTCASNLLQNLEQDDYDSNSVKRMKFEGTEKNLQMQELSKINKERILFGTRRVNMEAESSIDIDVDSDSDDDQDAEMELSEDDDEETDGGDPEMIAAGTSFTPSEVIAAEAAWQKYLSKNDSVIVDTFQGQFKSTVICSVCNQVSVTFEPFMYLSVPIPHAMERQICVIFISLKSEPMRYLLNLNKHDKVEKVKQELCSIIGRQDCEIILAEVLEWHISRILEDNSMLRYVNDSSRKIYAFELEPLKADAINSNNERETHEAGVVAWDTGSQQRAEGQDDIFSHMGSFNTDSCMFDAQTSFSNYQDCGASSSLADATVSASQSGVTLTADLGLTSDPQLSDLIGTSMWEWSERADDQLPESHDWNQSNNTASGPADVTVTIETGEDQRADNDAIISSSSEDKWKSCAICLEELTDNELMVHTSCGGTFCPSCLEMSIQHYGEASYCCPVCSTPAELSEDFVPLANAASHKPKTSYKTKYLDRQAFTNSVDPDKMLQNVASNQGLHCLPYIEQYCRYIKRQEVLTFHAKFLMDMHEMSKPVFWEKIVAVPITFRYEIDSLGRPNASLFAHPYIMNLPSNLTGDYIYDRVKDVMPVPGDFKVVMTDGQGLHCSRCLYMEHCPGCEILRDGEAILRPGDHLTVCIQEVSQNQIEHAQRFTDHKSLEKQRSKEPITLLDCFSAFTQSEELDEHNPWFCPHCQKNQLAKKTMTVWQYPDTLIIQLKRFVFHELSGTKVDNVVQFPIDNLDLQQYISGPKTKNLQYTLYSCVCHFGGANSGHYTAYAKHCGSGQWHYCNDETVSLQSPGEDDYSSTYVLFYQRKGTDRAIQIPDDIDLEEKREESVTSNVTSVADILHDPPEGVITLKNKQRTGVTVEQSEADSTLDFYT